MAKRAASGSRASSDAEKGAEVPVAADFDEMLRVIESPAEAAPDLELVDYWTPDRMARAAPVELPRSDSIAEFALEGVRPFAPGEEVVQPPLAPDGALEAPAAGANYSTSRVANLNVAPHAAVGKLFMTFGSIDKVGSAWVIDERAIVTAGHCIFDYELRMWARNVMFAPRYDGNATLGRWAMRTSSTLQGWQQSLSFAHDIAAVVLTRPIRPTTGAAGWMANVPVASRYLQVGYPAQPPFDGQRMWQSDGKYLTGSTIVTVGGNLTGGCSGGPMFVQRDGVYLVNGLNSHRPQNSPHVMNTPYFGDNMLKMAEWIRANGGGER